MLCCDFCDMWYHYTCVGLPKDIKLEKIKYKCVGCAIREGRIDDSEQPLITEVEQITVDPNQ